MHLVASTSNFLLTKAKLTRKTTTKKVFGTKMAKEFVAMTPLQRVLIPMTSKKKGKKSPKSNTSTVIRRDTTPPSVPRKQKSSIGLGDFHTND